MARGRMLNQTYAEDKFLAELVDEAGPMAALIYFGLIPFQDREGRVHGDPYVLKGKCWARVKAITPEVIEESLRRCHEKRLLVWYEAAGDRWLCFPAFRKNQPKAHLEREADSTIPPPPQELVDSYFAVRGVAPEQLRTNSGASPESSGAGPAEDQDQDQEKRRSKADRSSSTTSPDLVRTADDLAAALDAKLGKKLRAKLSDASALPLPASWVPEALTIAREAKEQDPKLDRIAYAVGVLIKWRTVDARAWPGSEHERARAEEDRRKRAPRSRAEPPTEEGGEPWQAVSDVIDIGELKRQHGLA